MSSTLDRLVELGLLEKQTIANDAVQYSITEAGRETLRRLNETPMERSTGNIKYLREEDCEDNDEGA